MYQISDTGFLLEMVPCPWEYKMALSQTHPLIYITGVSIKYNSEKKNKQQKDNKGKKNKCWSEQKWNFHEDVMLGEGENQNNRGKVLLVK